MHGFCLKTNVFFAIIIVKEEKMANREITRRNKKLLKDQIYVSVESNVIRRFVLNHDSIPYL